MDDLSDDALRVLHFAVAHRGWRNLGGRRVTKAADELVRRGYLVKGDTKNGMTDYVPAPKALELAEALEVWQALYWGDNER